MNALILPLLLSFPLLQDEGESPTKVEVPSNLKPTLERAAELLVGMQEDYSKADDDKTYLPIAKGQKEWPYQGVYRIRKDGASVIPMGYRIGGTSITATALLEALATHRTESGPERIGWPSCTVVRVVVEQVAKRRHSARFGRLGVIGTKDRGELRILEGSSDAFERIVTNHHVGVDEHQNVPCCLPSSEIACSRR